MGAQHSKTDSSIAGKRCNGLLKLKPTAAVVSAASETATTESCNLNPTLLKKYRINVPRSMETGELMSIKLGGIMTKVLITTPTSSTSTSTHEEEQRQQQVKECTSFKESESSSTSLADDSASSASAELPNQSANTAAASVDPTVVVASTDVHVPTGKMIVTAKPVVVVHAVFPHPATSKSGKQQPSSDDDIEAAKELMVERVMTEIIQETVNSGCNAVLGMTVSIKETHSQSNNNNNNGEFKKYDAFLVKACGTPCYLMPTQVVVTKTATSHTNKKKESEGGYFKIRPTTPFAPSRQRASSVELSLHQAWSIPANQVVGRAT